MDYRHLGRGGVAVSRICLGTMNFGSHTDPDDAHQIMDHALEQGQDAARGRPLGRRPSPFGYEPVKRSDGWYLEQHPLYASVVHELATRGIEGGRYNDMARWLTASGVPTPLDADGGKPRKDGRRRE